MSFWRKTKNVLAVVGLVVCGSTAVATAAQSASSHYSIDQTQFSSGSVLCDPGTNGSAHYCANQTAGDTAVGNTASSNFQAQVGGLVTDRNETLQLVVNTSSIDVGTLTASSTHVGTATFSVLSYLASGYAVYTSSPGPQNGSYTMHTLSSASVSSPGTEQFGINLVANSCPGTAPSSGAGGCSGALGANPTQIPDSTFSFGGAASGYGTPNSYKYVDGGQIATSNSSSGETDYTISYLFNISAVTPGGTYTMNQSIVATSTF